MAICGSYEQFRDIFATSSTLDTSGRKVWPVASVQTGLPIGTGAIFSNGNATAMLGVGIILGQAIATAAVFPYYISINGFAADAVAGTDEYDWYVSQHTDEVSRQYFRPYRTEEDPLLTPPATSSGTIRLALSTLGTSTFGATLSAAELARAFDHVAIYVQRKSDNAIWMFDPMRIIFSDATV